MSQLAAGPKDLDAVVARVGDHDHAAQIHIHIGRRRELAGAVADRADERAVGPKDLDAVVARVGDVKLGRIRNRVRDAHGGHKDPGRRREVTVAGAGRAEHERERAVRMKDLDAVVARVGDVNRAVKLHDDARRGRELAGAVGPGGRRERRQHGGDGKQQQQRAH